MDRPGADRERDHAGAASGPGGEPREPRGPGKTTLVAQAYGDPAAVQRKASGEGSPGGAPGEVAGRGVAEGGGELPHRARIQSLFGRHDVSDVTAHQGPAAREASHALGADAYAYGNAVAFAAPPDLHTAAHEAAHVVQQRGGVQLKGGMGEAGDRYERHADAVADAVVAGESAEALLDQSPGGGARASVVQRQEQPANQPAGGGGGAQEGVDTAATMATPTPGINAVAFIDTDDGANVRTGPAESGGQLVSPDPLPPGTQVFVSGTHPDAPQWFYVTAVLGDRSVRGYVQYFRVNTALPEPSAVLHPIADGEQAQVLADRKFGTSVRDGLDLRFYENVLLHVNRDVAVPPRDGITGDYQTGLDNNIRLVAGKRIWLVSAAYALTMVDVVPHGSITGGAVAKLGRIAGQLRDVLASVTESPDHFLEVAGEYAQIIGDHLPEIIGVVAGFIALEQFSAGLAATGVGAPVAALIQLLLAYLGARAAVQSAIEAAQHGAAWLTTAWNANGRPDLIAAASRDFVRMLVAIALAALAFTGAQGNAGNAFKLATSTATPALATAVVNGATETAAATTPAIATGGAGPIGAGILMMSNQNNEQGSSSGDQEEVTILNKDTGKPIGKFKRGEYLQLLGSGKAAELFGGPTIALDGEATVTLTGTLDDVNAVARRGIDQSGALNGATAMGENVGGINILRSPQWNAIKDRYVGLIETEGRLAYWRAVTDEFWVTVNKPWLDQAIARNDIFRLVSDPLDPLNVTVTENGVQILDNGVSIQSIFGREYQYLLENGYSLSSGGLMIRK